MAARKLHVAIHEGTKTFCHLTGTRIGASDDFLMPSGRGYTVTDSLRKMTCENCTANILEMLRPVLEEARRREKASTRPKARR